MSFFKENVKGSNVKPEILHEDKQDQSEKECLKMVFLIFDPFMVKMQSEKYLSIFSNFY